MFPRPARTNTITLIHSRSTTIDTAMISAKVARANKRCPMSVLVLRPRSSEHLVSVRARRRRSKRILLDEDRLGTSDACPTSLARRFATAHPSILHRHLLERVLPVDV